ncbi:MAG: hypothetical protein ACRCY8_12745 [Dermatophilaceae bacterium]
MADFNRGDRVFAIRNLGGGWSTTVPKGTKGTVVGVERPFLSGDVFTVKFDNDEIEDVSENDIYIDT